MFGKEYTKITLRGGTNAIMAPQIDYFDLVFNPIASQFGFNCDINLIRRGFFPIGKGEATLSCKPVKKLKPIVMVEKGKVVQVDIHSYVAGFLDIKIAQRGTSIARKIIEKSLGKDIKIVENSFKDETSLGVGSGMMYVCFAVSSIANA